MIVRIVFCLVIGAALMIDGLWHLYRKPRPSFPDPRPWTRAELDRMTRERWTDAKEDPSSKIALRLTDESRDACSPWEA